MQRKSDAVQAWQTADYLDRSAKTGAQRDNHVYIYGSYDRFNVPIFCMNNYSHANMHVGVGISMALYTTDFLITASPEE